MSANGTEVSQGSPKSRRPELVPFQMYGVRYELDLLACREALARRVIALRTKDAKASGLQLVARRAGVNRKTLYRFLAGEQVEVETFVDIVTRGLGLDAEDVLRKVGPTEESIPA